MKLSKQLVLFSAIFLCLVFNNAFAQKNSDDSLSALDKKIKAGFDSLSEKNWAQARLQFEEALKIYQKEHRASEFIFTKMSLPDEDPNEKLSDLGKQLIAFRHSMGTEQTLLEFLAFTAQLEGNSAAADKYIDQVYKLQSPIWGVSWKAFVPAAYSAFSSAVKPEKTENYGRYLFLAGDLISNVDDKKAFQLILEAQETRPKDPVIAANLTSFYIIRKDALNAKKQAQLSLSIDAKQNRVLIDLATAQWLLDEIDDAAKSANASIAIDPNLPGPHATLTLVALEKGDTAGALKTAATGVKLSGRHPYYLLVQAAAFEASGDGKQAEKLIREAFEKDLPTKDGLGDWFLRGKPLSLILTVISRLKGTDRVA